MYGLVHDIGKLVNFERGDHTPQVLFNILCLIYFVMEIYFLVWLSDAVIEEANKTGRILCRTASFEIDKKTKECVSFICSKQSEVNESIMSSIQIELFSLSILQGKKLMVACGMICVDKTLVFGVS